MIPAASFANILREIYLGAGGRNLRISAAALAMLWVPANACRGQGLQNLERLGFYGAQFTRADGFQTSSLAGMNASGQSFGWSDKYSGSTLLGHVQWVHSSADGTRIIGLTGTEFTRADGFQANSAAELTGGGWLRGSSERYLGTSADFGQAAWVADASSAMTTRVGFFDAAHTGGNYQYSEATFLTEDGVSGGYSNRYGANASVNLGQSAWLAKPVSGVPVTTRAGLSGGVYTRNDGYEFSVINRAVEEGHVGGYSRQFEAGTGGDLGQAAWVADWTPDGFGTSVVGFYDSGHTDSDGYQYSLVQDLNGAGYGSGYSERFGGGQSLGRTAWISAPGGSTTSAVGFTDAAHTRVDGYRYSEVLAITDSGWASGYSASYVAPVEGQTAWVAPVSSASTSRVGLTGGDYQSSEGREVSYILGVTESGVVSGGSQRFSGTASNGQAAWLAQASGGNITTVRVGLTDAEHTSSGNSQMSILQEVAESGKATGISYRYSGASYNGQSAWAADTSGTTVRIGLTGAEFTGSGGFQYSSPEYLTSSGAVLGYSERYDGGASFLGEASWYADGAGNTSRIGLYDSAHTRADGYQFSVVTQVTNTDFIAGSSDLFNGGGAALGATAWIYRPLLDQTSAISFSASLTGESNTVIEVLLDSGLAAGYYTLYDGANDMGLRAFAWLPGVGGFDLGAYIGGSQFSNLASVDAANMSNYIAGLGAPLSNSGQAVYSATVVPEPSPAWLLLLPALGMLWVAARGKAPVLGVIAAAAVAAQAARADVPVAFADWLAAKNVPAGFQGARDDPDGDGYMNALEYVFGTSPTDPDAPISVSPSLDTSDPSQAYFVYRVSGQSAGNAEIAVLTSTDLAAWEPAEGAAVERGSGPGYTVFAHPVTLTANRFYTLEVRIPSSSLSHSPSDSGGELDLVIHVGTNVGSAWEGLPPLANVSIRTEAAPVSTTDSTPDTSKYPGAAGAGRGNFTPNLLADYSARGVRPPLRSWMGWFLWGDGAPPPGINAGINDPGDYGIYDGSGWDYFNYQWPKDDGAPDGGRSAGTWNPVRLDQQPLFLDPFIVSYNWAPGPFGYESKPLKHFPLNTSYWQDKSIVRGINLSTVNPFFYQYGNKLTATSVPSEWHQAWLYLAMRPLETTVVVPGNLKPDEALENGEWNKLPNGSNDPFPYPVWDKTVSAEKQTPFAIKVDRVGDFDADLIWEAANPRFADYYSANRYRRTAASQPGKGNYLKMTVGQGFPFAWCETNNSRYATFYNLIRSNTEGRIANNAGTGAGLVEGGVRDVPGVSGVKYVLLYGDQVNPNQWYQETPPWYFDTPSKQPGGFNPPAGEYITKAGGNATVSGQHNHTYTAIFFKADSVKPIQISPQPSAPGYNNGTDAQGNPFFFLEFVNPGKNWFVVATVPPMRYYHTGVTLDRKSVLDQAARDWAEKLGQYAFNFPISTRVSYSVDNMTESSTTFATTVQNPYSAAGASGAGQMIANPTDTVIALKPHHYQPITLGPDLTKVARPEVVWNPLKSSGEDFPVPTSAPPNANRNTPSSPSRWSYWSLKGNLKPIIAGSFTVSYPFQNFLPAMPPPDYSREVQQSGIPGIIITDVGTGYHKISESPVVTITDSSGAGFGASARALVDAYRGEIQQIDVVSSGQGYPDGMPPQTVTVTVSPPASPNGRQATAYAQVGGGKVLAIFMLDKGAGYSSVINVAQSGSSIDAPLIVPNFDPVTGDMLPGLVSVIEEGAGFDFSRPIDVTIFGTGTGAQFQVIRPGNLIQIDPPLAGSGGAGSYPSVNGNPPPVTVSIEPPSAGVPAQTGTAHMAKIPNGFQPAIVDQGDYADGASLEAHFMDDSPTPQAVPLMAVVGGGKLLGLGLGTNPPATFVLNGPKDVVFSGGAPARAASARVYPTYSVASASISGNLVGGYSRDVQVSFLAQDQSDPAVPAAVAPQLAFSIPANGTISASDLTITHGGSGLTYDPVSFQVFGGTGFDAALQPVLDSAGGVKTVRVLRTGSNYLPSLKLWFNQGGHTGTPAQGEAVVQDGKLVAVNITDAGSGYNSSLSVVPIAPTYAGGPANPDPVVTDNPKGYPAVFTATLANGTITGFTQAMPPSGIPLAKYIPGTEGASTADSPPALLWCTSNVPFPRVTSPAFFFRGRVAPASTGVSEVVYNSIISQYTTLTGNDLAPYGGGFLGSSAPDGYGLGNQLGAAGNFLGDIFNLQQYAASQNADYPDVPIASYALSSAAVPASSYEYPVFAENNPFGGLTDSLKSAVQAMQRSLSLLFQDPPSHNNIIPQSLASTWGEAYYAQYDPGVGRMVINPTATQPAWGVVSSVQNPATVDAQENSSKTGLSKWEKGMLWSGFGVSDQWNDQHYFYGYYISAAALAGIFDRSWETSISGKPADLWASAGQMGTAIDQLVMTLAYDPDNPALESSLFKNGQLTYQKFAFFDQFGGHPWATGLTPGSTTAVLDTSNAIGYWGAYGTLSDKYNGENENSIYEGIQAWSATILWGGATDRKPVVDLGIYLYTTNVAAGEAYFLDKNYNLSNSGLNAYSWTPVTTVDSSLVINNGDNGGWPANTGYVDANPIAFYQAPEAFGGNASAGQSLTKKAELTLNNYFYAYPTGSRFIQAYPPEAWTLGMARNSTYMRKWAGTTMRQEWTDARNSALYQPAQWLSMSMTAAVSGVPYQPGDQPYPMTGTTPNTPAVEHYIDRLWASWVTTGAAPGANAARNPSILPTSVLTFLSALKDQGTPDWTYVARATDASGEDDNGAVVFTAAFSKETGPNIVETTFVAFNPGWETRHAVFYRLNPDGSRGTQPVSGTSPLEVGPKKMVTHKVIITAQ